MSTLGIFLIGLFVTALVGGALALVIVGAIQDGRKQEEADHGGELEATRSGAAPKELSR